MASVIQEQTREYEELLSSIKDIHNELSDTIADTLMGIESLNQEKAGFYVTNLTPKVNLMIKELSRIKESIEAIYDAEEQLIKSFPNTIRNYDVKY